VTATLHTLDSVGELLVSLAEAGVEVLVMGGQAVWAYHAAVEGSRDLDVCVVAHRSAIPRLRAWLVARGARQAYLPPLERRWLDRGHTCHFVVPLGGGNEIRVDFCTRPARIPDPERLPERAQQVALASGHSVRVLSRADLVATKKTQRVKDWAAIQALVDQDIATADQPPTEQVRWWLREARDAETLAQLAAVASQDARTIARERPAVAAALAQDLDAIDLALGVEQARGIAADRAYQKTLARELEELRHRLRRSAPPP
jgi:hypothetical protein